MKAVKKRIAELLALAVCFSIMAVPAAAYARVDTNAEPTLELHYYDEDRDVALTGMELRLYKVAEMSDAVHFTVTEDFQEASVFQEEGFSLEELDREKWGALCTTLSAFVAADRANATDSDPAIQPTASGAVGETGTLKFEELDVGLYLLVGDRKSFGHYTYTPTAFLTTLPMLDTQKDEWVYDVVASNKFSRIYHGDSTPTPSYISKNVMKVWKDDDNAAGDRPQEVTVQLLCNGEVYDTVTLNGGNGWKNSWINLDSTAQWQLVEQNVPEDYTVMVEPNGNTFVVTNTYNTEIPDDPVPRDPGKDNDGDTEDIFDEEIPLAPALPQTGVLWWPVQVLAGVGLFLFVLGWLDMRNGKKDPDEA